MANQVRFVDNVGVSAFGSTAGNDALINAVANENIITFTKGDNSQFSITVDTGSGGGFFNTSSLMITASVAGSDLTFTKGDGSTFTVALPSGGGGGGNGIFTQIGSTDQFQATSSLKISGSTLFETPLAHSTNLTASDGAAKYALVVSESVWHRNANVGVPTTNAWQSNLGGTFFNRFDHNTDIAEMLRYMIGVLSGSAIGPDFADTEPNTNTWDTVSTSYAGISTVTKNDLFHGVLGGTNYESGRLSIDWTSSAFINFSKTASYREAQQYYTLKGFTQASDRGTYGNDTGTNPFHGSYGNIPGTILNNTNFETYAVSSTANKTGNSTVFSNTNFFGMGALTSGNATPYTVRIIASQSYSDNASNTNPDQSSNTFHTSSFIDYTIDAFGSTGQGLFLGKINPPSAELPSAFQDGRFVSTPGPITGRFYTGGATSKTTISSSGYYKMHGVVSGLKTGSMSVFQFKTNTNAASIFYTPNPYQSSFTSEGALEDITNSQPSAVVSNLNLVRTAFTATSRSLSGAPYLKTLNYQYNFSSEVSKSFDPVYGANRNGSNSPLVHSKSDNWASLGPTPTFTPTTVSVTNSGVQTTGGTSGVLSADKSTQRSNGNIPHINDISFLSSSYNFTLNTTYNALSSNPTLTFTSTGKNFRGTNVASNSTPQNFYDATLFGQNSDSGSLQIYTQNQGYDSSTLTGFNEYFTGETFRIKITDALLNSTYAAGDKFITGSFQTNDEGDNVIGVNDLQVIPGSSQGKLVKPGDPSNGYWLPALNSAGYSYYARVFNMDSGGSFGQQNNLKIDVGNSGIVHWGDLSGTSTIAVAVIMQSSTAASLGGSNKARFTDIKNSNSEPSPGVITAGTTGTNPFGVDIDIRTNSGDGNGVENGISTNTRFIIPLLSPRGTTIDSGISQIIVLVRYKGNPTPITRINAFTN